MSFLFFIPISFEVNIKKIPTINIKILNPKANYQDKVLVANYRRKGRLQEGKVLSLEYANNFGEWSWSYTVLVKGENGRSYRLYVGDDKIEFLNANGGLDD